MLNFNDERMRKIIIEKEAEKTIQEQEIKENMDEIEYWYRIESQVIEENEKLLKEYKEEFRKQMKQKNMDLRNMYTSKRVREIQQKYKLSHIFNGC